MKHCERDREQKRSALSYIQILVFSKIVDSARKKKKKAGMGILKTAWKAETNMSAKFIFKNMSSTLGCSPFTLPDSSPTHTSVHSEFCTFEV